MRKTVLLLILFITSFSVSAQAQLSQETKDAIDKLANDTLARSGVPSASIAVVKDGQVVYIKAYGNAKLEPQSPATSEMRYSIGSISKQFTAASILLLQEQGKLSLDDKVAKFIPDLTRANEVTIRQLLSHTSGYQDYWPQDYVMPMMLQPTTAQKIIDMWAKKALDFDPGTKWQYSNTNYVIAGLIIEKASGMPMFKFMQQKIFTPLGMNSVANIDQARLGDTDAVGYMRYALGPLRVAPKEGSGWLFAAGELAMSPQELATWDISLMDRKLLKPASYRQMETEAQLTTGIGTRYGLGLSVSMEAGHRAVSHGGEVSGFTTENIVFPDDRVAIVALSNQDAASAASTIAHGIVPMMFAVEDPTTAAKTEQARKILEGFQKGTIDRSLFTSNANAYLSDQALKDLAAGLAPLGAIQDVTQTSRGSRGGMILRVYRARFGQRNLRVWTYEMPDGKLEQYQIAPQ